MRTALALVIALVLTIVGYAAVHRPFYWLAQWGQDAGIGGPLLVILVIAVANGYAAHLGSYLGARIVRGVNLKAYGIVFAVFTAVASASTLFGENGPGGFLAVVAMVVITGLISFGAYVGAMLGQSDGDAVRARREIAVAAG